ncbi:MAG: hypothetical protein H0X31_01075 [Nostocaceae cyanobacterium]|nr:hypothetical protein [Nostocaceae cyanobacterium]
MAFQETIINMPFDKWIEYMIASSKAAFEADAIPSEIWWDEERHPEIAITHLTHFFENINDITPLMSNEEYAQLLKYIIDLSFSGYTFVLMNLDNGIPVEARIHCIKSIYFVFDKLFKKRCPLEPFLGHISQKDPLDTVCFMWWDVIGIAGHPREDKYAYIDRTILEVIENILRLDSEACRESALHGLNEWCSFYPKAVKEIIHRFLNANSKINPQLAAYALKAQGGALP